MNAYKWITAAFVMSGLISLAGCGNAAPMTSEVTPAEATIVPAEVEQTQRTPAEGETPSDSLREQIAVAPRLAAETAVDDDSLPTLVFVNNTPSQVSFYLDGRGPYRLAGGQSSYSPITISVGVHTIDTYDRNDQWVKRATLDAAAGMAYTYSVWVE